MLENGDVVAENADHGQIVADEYQRKPEPFPQLPDQQQNMGLGRDIEAGNDLVGDNEVRLERQRAGDTGALPLPARELMRIAVDEMRRQAHEVQQFRRTVALIPPALQAPEHLKRPRQRDREPKARVQRRLRILKDHLDARPQRSQFGLAEIADFNTVELNSARRRPQQPHQQPAQGRLARAGLADQTEHRSTGNREIDMLDDLAERRTTEQC